MSSVTTVEQFRQQHWARTRNIHVRPHAVFAFVLAQILDVHFNENKFFELVIVKNMEDSNKKIPKDFKAIGMITLLRCEMNRRERVEPEAKLLF